MDNKHFKQIQHNPIEPVSVMREGDDAIVVQGVKFTGDFFRAFAAEKEKRGKAPIIRTLHDAFDFLTGETHA